MLLINIFISYRTADEAFRDKIIECLKPLELSYQQRYKIDVKVWYDEEGLISGDDLKKSLSENLEKSHIVICLLTREYFKSEWCKFELTTCVKQTLPPSKKRVIPVVCESVNWDTDYLGNIKAIPPNAKPISDWDNENEVYTIISKEIDRNIKVFANPKVLDFRTKQRSILDALFQEKPDLKASVKSLMCLVDEHSPESIGDAIQIHIILNTYEGKENDVKLEELAKTRCDIVKKIFVIVKEIEQKYAL